MPADPTEARPRLVAVEGESPAEQAAESPPSRRRPGVGRLLVALLAVLFAMAVLQLFEQAGEVSRLEGQVSQLTGELAEAQADLAAYESQLGRVRGLVSDLGARLEELQAVVESDPREGPVEEGETL